MPLNATTLRITCPNQKTVRTELPTNRQSRLCSIRLSSTPFEQFKFANKKQALHAPYRIVIELCSRTALQFYWFLPSCDAQKALTYSEPSENFLDPATCASHMQRLNWNSIANLSTQNGTLQAQNSGDNSRQVCIQNDSPNPPPHPCLCLHPRSCQINRSPWFHPTRPNLP